jgi:MFS family permease
MRIAQPVRTLILICLASVGWSFGFGLGAPLTSLWLRDAGSSDTLIGLNAGVYYFGIAIAAGFVPAIMCRWGRYCPVVGMVVSGLTVAGIPWGGSMAGWVGLRFLTGVAGAMSLIPLETRVNRDSPPDKRARNFGFYAFSIAGGWALGNFVGLAMYDSYPRTAFVLGGAASILGGLLIVVRLSWPAESVERYEERGAIGLRRNFVSFGTAWYQGFLEGGMVAFMSVYLLFLGLSETRVGWLTSSIMIGVILFQVPVAWLADRVGRIRVLLGCYAVTATGLGFLIFCGDSVWLAIWLWLVGACSGAFYPLGLAILGEKLPGPRLARANAWFLGINCCGSLTGPVVIGVAMDCFGKAAMFSVGAVTALGVWGAWAALRALDRRQVEASSTKAVAPVVLQHREAA